MLINCNKYIDINKGDMFFNPLSLACKLNKIEIIQNNEKRVDCFENKFLVYKTNAENDVYDTLLWANHNITTATIPSSVTTIRSRIFHECSSLTQITIPSSVTEIGSSAFRLCSSLRQITIPSSVTKIGDSVFMYCSLNIDKLESVQKAKL